MAKRRNLRRLLSRTASRRLNHETLEKRELLAIDIIDGAPRLVGANPNAEGLFAEDALNELKFSPSELTFRFDGGQRLDPTTLGGIQITASGGDDTFGDGNEIQITPGFLGFRENEQTVVARFSQTLADDRYRIEISGEDDPATGTIALRNFFGLPFRTIDGETVQTIDFDVETGGKVIAVVPQPIDPVDGTLVRRDNQIDVYFDDADLFRPGSNLGNREFYQLIDTRGTVTTEDDQSFNPIPGGVVVDPVLKKVTLEFASSLETLVAGASSTSFRLRIGDTNDFETLAVEPFTPVGEPGITATTATDLTAAANGSAVNGNWTLLVDQQISNTGLTPMADNPGGNDEIGHRDIEVETHLGGGDGNNGIEQIAYTFLRNASYGNDVNGDPLYNQMNEAQEQRFREVLDLYDSLLGIDFYETEGSGLRLIVGDLFTADPTRVSGPGGVAGLGGPGGVTMDFADFTTSASNQFGGSFFNVALHEIGHAIGLGHAYDLEGAVMGAGGAGDEVFPNPEDIVHGEYLHQKESLDVDLYKVVLDSPGTLTAQTLAERLSSSSLLDTRLSLFREVAGKTELVSANDDYFGSDSFVEMQLAAGTYYVGVSAEGNDSYDIESGLTSPGGVSQGAYNLRLEFRPDSSSETIVDADGSALDGDRDGVVGGNYNFWFETAAAADTLYVRKPDISSDEGGNGSLVAPFDNIDDALAVAATKANAVVRVLANDGLDNDVTTLADNEAYEIGFVPGINVTLDDGRNVNVPDNTTLVVDAGVILKFLDSRISVGSDTDGFNRSGSSIQVLGTPQLPVYFTSYNDHAKGINSNPNDNTPAHGDWGGIEIRNDIDREQGRPEAERQGIFQNYLNHASIEFGGGQVSTINRVVDPIHLSEARAEVSYNTIVASANAAMSADPNTFQDTSFASPRFQRSSISGNGFVADYDRVGPDVHGNVLSNNLINGLYIRIDTQSGSELEQLQVSARFDDTDIVHVLDQSLLLEGQSGGPVQESVRPSSILGLSEVSGGSIDAGTYQYRYTFVDMRGFESLASSAQAITVTGINNAVLFSGITAATGDFVSRRLYRSDNGGAFRLVAELDRATNTYTDRLNAAPANAPTVSTAGSKLRGRPDAGLVIDPGMIIKSDGARIELGFGTTLIAEGNEGSNVIFTSIHDDRFGQGSTFDTNNDGTPGVEPAPGDWAGIYAGRVSRVSIDQAVLAYGGGVSGVEGSTAGFNVLEVQQANARIANSLFELNADGSGGQSGGNRQGRLSNSDATIHVTGAQPTIVGNTFVNNSGAVININVNSLDSFLRQDTGRQSGDVALYEIPPGNNGPVIRGNKLDGNDVNGLEIRGNTLFTEVVWDDTDIVHVVRDDVVSTNFHVYNGLRLESSDEESLVVKLDGAALSATGASLDITDRIGGRLQVLGTPGHPVIMTALTDCSAGAGFTPDGRFQVETIGGLTCSAIASATSAPYADIIIVMDETITMRNTQVFTAQFIQDLEAGLLAAGIGNGSAGGNRYGAVGFASRIQGELGRSIPVGAGGALFGTASEYAGIVNQYASDGTSEDGYAGIDFALQNYQARPEAAKFIILASDEDRDELNANLTFATTLSELQSEGFNFQAIVNLDITDDTGQLGLAIDADNTYLENGSTFTVSPGGSITGGFGTTVQDYFGLVTATGGIAGDIDQIAASAQTANVFSQVLVSSIVVQAGGSIDTGTPGDWTGIKLDPYSHDRNVDTELELEGNISGSGDTNAVIGAHQELGTLAPDELSGDEDRRLGFTVFGAIAAGSDQDVYSFKGTAGTMVWIDIDRTDSGLDTLLEFLDGDGNVLALSEDSRFESQTGQLTYVNPRDVNAGDFVGFESGHALPMQLDPAAQFNAAGGGNKDFYGTNDGDAGMRVVLPGSLGSQLTYYVRVRSTNPTTNFSDPAQIASSLTSGITSGGYQLQIRLRETDEIGGSVIRYADIRYASIGIEAIGLPAHSPLAGELFNPGGTVDLGGFDDTDRGAVSVGGTANGTADSYTFTVGRDGLQGIPGGAGSDPIDHKVSTVIDVDYADGLQRPDTGAYLYHDGVLVAIGTNSNVLDDRVSPSIPNQTTDPSILPDGSLGPKDPFIGPLELSTEGTYEVVITNNQQIPPELRQFTDSNPANPLARLEPLDSTIRIADDRFDVGVENKPVPVASQGPVALQVAFADNGSNIVPWHLGDVPLIAVTDSNTAGNTRLSIYNPLTGRHDSIVSQNTSVPLGAVARSDRGDIIAIRDSGTAGNNDGNTSTTYSIDAEGTINSLSSTGIATYEYFRTTGTNPTDTNRLDNEGMEFSSLTFYNDTNSQTRFLYGLANRGNFDAITVGADNNGNDIVGPSAGLQNANNLIYRLDPDSGAAVSRGGNNMTGGFESADPLALRIQNNYTNFNFPPETPWAGTNVVAQIQIPTISPSTGGYTGNVVEIVTDPSGGQFLWAFTDTGAVWRASFSENASTGSYAAGDIRGFATLVVDPTVVGAVAGTDFIADQSGNKITFERVTSGPANYQNPDAGIDIRNLYFGIGRIAGGQRSLYAFDMNNRTAQPVFAFGSDSVPINDATTSANFRGVFFSSLDQNLWHLSDTNEGAAGHGMPQLDNDARPNIGGGAALRFGFDDLNNDFSHLSTGIVDSTPDASDLQNFSGYNFLGGAHGTVQSNSLDLTGFVSEDLPTLYFTYVLDSEGRNSGNNLANTPMRDSLRVYVAGDDGVWRLVATNNFNQDASAGGFDWDDQNNPREYDPGISGFGNSGGDRRFVQQLFDGPGYRQARIDLGTWAGQQDVKIRFEFSTAGEARPDQSEIIALPGNLIGDGHTITVSGKMPDRTATNLGATLPSLTKTFEFDVAGNGVGVGHIPINISPAMSIAQVRNAIQQALVNEIHYANGSPTTNAFPIVGDGVRLYDLSVTQSLSSGLSSVAGNDSIATAQNLDGESWTLGLNANILNSTTRPHLTIDGVGDGTYDYFEFNVADAGAVATFDIESASFDTELHLYDAATGVLLATDDDGGAGLNSFIQHTFAAPGTYVIGVAAFNSFGDPGGISGATVPGGGTYQLHVSVDGIPVNAASRSGRLLTLVQGQYSNGPNLPASQFGVYQGSPTNLNDLVRAGQRTIGLGGDNGVYIDDIVIGLAERGESVGGANNATPISNLADNPYYQPVFADSFLPETNSGPYQLEVRLAREYGDPNAQTGVFLGKLAGGRVEINERLAEGLNLVVTDDGSQINDGDTFTLSNGSDTLTFEFNRSGGVTAGNVAVFYDSTYTVGEIAGAVRNAINQVSINTALEILATNQGGQLGSEASYLPTDPVIAIHGFIAADNLGGLNFGSHLSGVLTGGNQVLGEDNGDRNRPRDQGQLLIDSNKISFSSGFGIVVDAGPTTPIGPFNAGNAEGNRPKPGAVQRFPTLNTAEQVPGAVIRNNLLYNNTAGGVRVSGDTSTGAPSGYSRLVNNTIYGSNVGIQIDDQAAPALLNNVVMNNGTGIVGINEAETLIRATVYSGNGTNVNGVSLGTEAIVNPIAQLFVNPNPAGFDFAAGSPNFFPAAGSPLIDSSVPSQNDRPLIVSVKEVVGIPPSPVKVSERDLLGQSRGQAFFADRGAIDRLDDQGPIAKLLVPLDNDAEGNDVDPRQTVLQLTSGRLFEFSILLDDGEGTGTDASTITPNRITVTENGRLLASGADYVLGYSSNSGNLRLTPTSGEWRPDSVYVIRLSNGITDLAGNPLTPNQSNGTTRFTIVMPEVDLDYGDAPASYQTTLSNNGARHPIVRGGTPRLGGLIDSETDATPFPGSDDARLPVTAASASSLFAIDDSVAANIRITASDSAIGGEVLTLTVNGTAIRFELVESTSSPGAGNIAVPFAAGDAGAEVAANLVATIKSTVPETKDTLVVSIDPTDSASFTLVSIDDEDGVPVGSFVGAVTTEGLILANNSGQTSDPGEVIAFFNRADAAGAVLPVTVTGTGLLDVWIDFNADGDFKDFGERVFDHLTVSDGVNNLRIVTPVNAVLGATFVRFRISTDGTDSPGGVANNGEVEDYRITIFDIALPQVFDDAYSVAEDTVLTVDDPLLGLFFNDNLPTEEFVQPQYTIDATLVPDPIDTIYRTVHGQVRVDDPAMGLFTYTPDPDYYGPDSFRYTVSTQRNAGPEADAIAVFATVNITVTPVNDPPSVAAVLLRTIEDIQEEDLVNGGYLISASDLLVGAAPIGNPMVTTPPQDESNQQVYLQSIATVIGGVTTTIDGANPSIELDTIRGGKLTATFDANDHIVSILYRPALDFNSENLPAMVGDFLDDEFIFTVVDDGISLPEPSTAPQTPAMPETATATAFIRVTPQNDPPVPLTDDVSITDPAGDYLTYYTNLGVTAPVPTEDQTLIIPSALLLQNDEQGRATAADEQTEFNGNDGPMRITSVALVDPNLGQSISVDPTTGDITFVPADDVFGEVLFTYTVEDAGIDQDAALNAGNPAAKSPAPLSTTITSRIFLEPINDTPIAVDRAFNVTEAIEARPPGAGSSGGDHHHS